MTIRMLLAALGTVALLSTATVQAEPASPSPTPPTAATKATRSAKSLDCSRQANEKGLHGKERRKFRRQCMRGR
jgi:hypothetical protein